MVSGKTNKTKKKVKKQALVSVVSRVKYLPISDRKLRLVAEEIKGLSPLQAIVKLKFLNKKAARILTKAIKSAIANAENNFGLNKESLSFETILVNKGPVMKRRDVYHGARFNGGIIKKPRTHLVIKLSGEKV